MKRLETNALAITHRYMKQIIRPGDFVVDATVGNGRDTLLLSELVGETGHVTGFDIQQQALETAGRRLIQAGTSERVTLILDGHQNMKCYVKEPVKAVTFNFGYLPGGDHRICTHADTSIAAIESAIDLLKDDGVILLGIYYGGDSGFEEKDALMTFLQTLNPHEYSVLCHNFINYPNCPPLAVRIIKEKR